MLLHIFFLFLLLSSHLQTLICAASADTLRLLMENVFENFLLKETNERQIN